LLAVYIALKGVPVWACRSDSLSVPAVDDQQVELNNGTSVVIGQIKGFFGQWPAAAVADSAREGPEEISQLRGVSRCTVGPAGGTAGEILLSHKNGVSHCWSVAIDQVATAATVDIV
jgi:hypothetical protein